jgi:hypothetical protein
MTTPEPPDAARRAVWIAFADHFLDTETRHRLPWAALAAVEAGYSVGEAGDIWVHEIWPAVGGNLLCVAGEWALWDEDWLVGRILEVTVGLRRPRLTVSYLSHWIGLHCHDPSWVAIEAIMRALFALEPSARRALASDLDALARHYFDCVPPDLALHTPGRRDHLRRLYTDVFLPAFRPTVVRRAGESAAKFAARVEEALR